MGAFRYGLRYWKKHVPASLFVKFLGGVAIVIDSFFPLLFALFVDYIINYNPDAVNNAGVFNFLINGDFGAPETWQLFFNIALFVVIFVVARLAILYLKNTLFQYRGLKFESELRDISYKKLVDLDSATITQYNTGELLTTLNSDVIIYKEMYSRYTVALSDSILVLIITSIFLWLQNPYFLIIPAVIAPLLVVALVRYMRAARRISEDIRKRNGELNLTVQENIGGVRLVRAFANEDVEESKFDARNNGIKDAYIAQVDTSSKYNMLFNIIRQVAYLSAIALGVVLAFQGRISIGAMTACSTFVVKIMDHITALNNNLYQFQYGLVSGGRIMEFLEKESRVAEPDPAESLREKPNIEFENVTITADGKSLLKNINLSIPYGKKVGIMGGTGSGKSVLLKSLVRIYEPTQGRISINGKDIRKYHLDDLRNEFAYVFQDVFLFSNTVDANIAFYSPETGKSNILKVAQLAQADKFIKGLPQGYSTIVGEKGLGLSGGQKQRVSIARALLKDAPVLVLDDASSALDVLTERKVMSGIKEKSPDKTVIIAAHRVTSVADCDEILYLQDGEIIERGTFEEMMALNGRFAAIYKMQTTEGDIDNLVAVTQSESDKEAI